MKTLLISFGMMALATSAFAFGKKEKAAVPDATIQQAKLGEVVNGVAFDAKELEGKVVVLELWGVNCAPCVASLPEMQRLAKSGERKGLVVVGIECQASSKEAINKVLKNARVSYPVVAGGSLGFHSPTIPYVGIYGADGKLLWAGSPNHDDFKSEVRAALKTVSR